MFSIELVEPSTPQFIGFDLGHEDKPEDTIQAMVDNYEAIHANHSGVYEQFILDHLIVYNDGNICYNGEDIRLSTQNPIDSVLYCYDEGFLTNTCEQREACY